MSKIFRCLWSPKFGHRAFRKVPRESYNERLTIPVTAFLRHYKKNDSNFVLLNQRQNFGQKIRTVKFY
mgnify:CR=1 FL=1